MERKKKLLYNKIFLVASILFLVLGSVLLAATTGRYTKSMSFLILIIGVAGLVFAYIVAHKRWAIGFYFFGIMTFFSSLVIFASKLLRLKLIDYWPLFAISAGVCFYLTTKQYYKKHNRKYTVSAIVPSIFLILFGIFCSVFSFGFSSMNFDVFLRLSWPSFIIAAGILLFVVYTFRQGFLLGDNDKKNLEDEENN